jgi:type II secretory pathway pseudopilin PulG
MTMVEVLIALGVLGIALSVLLKGQTFIEQSARLREQKVTLWAVEKQFQTQSFSALRDVIMRSLDPSNDCRPCATSIGVKTGATGSAACRPLATALSQALTAFDGNVRLYSTRLSLVSANDPMAADLSSAPGFVGDAAKRCAKSHVDALGDLSNVRSLYTCFHIRPSVDNDKEGRLAAQKERARPTPSPTGGISTGEQADESHLEQFFDHKVVFAELNASFQDLARNAPLTCDAFDARKEGVRGFKLYYTIYVVDETKPASDADRYVRLRGSFSARGDK